MRLPLHGERGDALQLHGQGGGGGAGGGSSSQQILLLLTNRQLFSQICRQLLYFCFSQTGRQLLYFCFSQIGRYCTSASHRQVQILYFCFSQTGCYCTSAYNRQVVTVLLLLTDRYTVDIVLLLLTDRYCSYCTFLKDIRSQSLKCFRKLHVRVVIDCTLRRSFQNNMFLNFLVTKVRDQHDVKRNKNSKVNLASNI